MAVPVLESARLRLRGHRPDDLPACAAMWGDPDVTRHISARPFTREEVWARVLRYSGHWTLNGFGFWLVEEKASGRFVGEVGMMDFQRDIDPPLTDPEAGWALATWAHGRGFATEALGAALVWGDREKGLPRVSCIIDPGNAASVAVARKCGFRPLREAVHAGRQVLVHERAAPVA